VSGDEKRVVLVKPGDVLLLGNIGRVESPEQVEPIVRCLGRLGITALLFSADIKMDTRTP
jgi:hypothetical protein